MPRLGLARTESAPALVRALAARYGARVLQEAQRHPVGHACEPCDALRALGPAEVVNPLVRLMAEARGRVVDASETEARALEAYTARRAARARLLDAIRTGQPTRSRRAA